MDTEARGKKGRELGPDWGMEQKKQQQQSLEKEKAWLNTVGECNCLQKFKVCKNKKYLK